MKIEGLFLISGGKTAVVFELEEQILNQMALLVCVPVCVSGMLCIDAVGNDYDPSSSSYPANKFVAVITLIGQNQPASQVKWFPLESKKRNGFPGPSVTAWTFVVKPPLLRPVSSWYPLF